MKLNKILASMGAGCFFLILIKLGNYGYLDKYFNFMHSLSRSGNTTSISEYRPTYNKNEPIITDIKPVETSNTKNSIEPESCLSQRFHNLNCWLILMT